jgi:signal peptidase I
LLDASLDAGADACFRADGSSMLPLIWPGDTLVVRRLADEEPRTGDVAVIGGAVDGSVLVHRVVRVRDGRALVRGDNTTLPNGEYPRERILGLVTTVERDGRRVWFGAGLWGWLVALVVRLGLVNYYNRACLKFAAADSRLRERKGDDGKE